jgi:hypothetical protein
MPKRQNYSLGERHTGMTGKMQIFIKSEDVIFNTLNFPNMK